MDVPADDRQKAKDALAYVTTMVHRNPGERTGADLLKALAAGGTDALDLLEGAVSLISLLVLLRQENEGIPPEKTIQELGAILTRDE